MKVELAKTAGFCFGVKRAVDTVYKEIEKGEKVYTFGPIIHNDEVISDIMNKGVGLINTIEELKDITCGTIIIRSHGVSKDIYDLIKAKGLKIVDATCPYVLKIHKIVNEQSENGRHIIIIGNDTHPEVEGIKGWCKDNYTIIEKEEDVNKLYFPKGEMVCIVSQTTFNYKKFQELVEIISKKGYDIIVLNTICNATEERQTEARRLAKESDAMIVIGGLQSSNTRKLYEISKSECENTYYIQTLRDLDLEEIKSFRSVGITAGASTPNNIIKEVHTACQK
jgi:4-hydroxy-3-methylbut-2-en-1-yl diphosphate reductase